MALKNPDKNLTSVPHIQTAGTWYQFGKYRFDPHARVVLQGRERLPLTPKAVETLRVLVENAGSLVSTETLMNEVWPDAFVEEGSLTRNISDLRRALRSRTHIETVSKRGYRFVTPVRRYQVAGADAPWTVGVRPLQPASTHESLAGLGHAIANALVTKLSAIRGCAAHISGGGGGTSRGELAKVERRRAPDLLVRGTIQRRNRVIRASVEFVGAREASPVWTETIEHSLGGPESLEESISEELAGAVALWFSKRHRKLLAKRYTRNVVAYQRYLTGHFHASKRSEQGLHDAVRCFRESVELDSEYALAYAGLAAAYALLPMLRNATPDGTCRGRGRPR